MDERFLHYAWKYLKFELGKLQTTTGDPIRIIHNGNHNHDSGPDFEEARIRIGHVEWAGAVEIHVNASDWNKHNHHLDEAYNNVILHVVWKDDETIFVEGEKLPALELSNVIEPAIWNKYNSFIQSESEITCAPNLNNVSGLAFSGMLDRVGIERLQRKASEILSLLNKNHNDWESTTYWSLAKSFGFSVNKESFMRLASILPYQILKKYHNQIECIEALIYGQAGFLEGSADEYQSTLWREYSFLKTKHNLPPALPRAIWKYGKMRPSNFPSVRLAQFASLLSSTKHLFSQLVEVDQYKQLQVIVATKPSIYWQAHYDFGKKAKRPNKNLGRGSVESIGINVVAPILAAYRNYTGNQKYMDQAINLLSSITAEKNRFTKKWENIGRMPEHALDSQAMIGLYKDYCRMKKCLDCAIGVEIVSK